MTQANEQNRIQEQLHTLQEALASGELAWVRQELKELHPAEIAELLEALPPKERDILWDLVAPELEGDVLADINDQVRVGLLEDMQPHQVAEVTKDLDVDDVADILQDLPEPVVDEVLRSMDEQDRIRLSTILLYPEDTAGGLMNLDVVTVRSDVSIDVVMRFLRLREELPENTNSLMVVDRDNHYLGELPLSVLLTNDPDKLVDDVMVTSIEGIPATMNETDVANLFDKMDLISAAVVDEYSRLLGIIMIDDVVDVIREHGDSNFMSQAGLDEEDDMFAPVMLSARRRAIWLAVNLATAFMAAGVIGLFEATLQQMVALAVLMPVVASMGGIAGSQTLTLVIRGIALGQIGSANARALLSRELLVGAINSVLWAIVVGFVSAWWFNDTRLGIIIGSAMIINLITAAAFGVIIPLVLKRFHVDPALAGGVVLTTFTDVVGFMAFLGLATLFLI